MPSLELQPGVVFRRSLLIGDELCAPSLSVHFACFAGMPPVFATAYMVALVEWACIDGLRPFLLEGEHTVGTLIDVSHIAATPARMRVTAEARLVAVVGRTLRFLVHCHDERELVGKGSHERTIVRAAGFTRRAEMKGTHSKVA